MGWGTGFACLIGIFVLALAIAALVKYVSNLQRREDHDYPGGHHHLPAMRCNVEGGNANGRLPIILRMSGVRGRVETEARRLLRLLLLCRRILPAGSGSSV
jgi:hypothetical protein